VLVVVSWMSATAVIGYLDWRLRRFNLNDVITPEATRLVARCSGGCFASVDHICQMALLLLRNRSADHIDVLLVREAIRALRRQREPKQDATRRPEAEVIVSLNGDVLHKLTAGERLLIGRSHLNDICLESGYLSRHHLAIIRGESGYYLSDLNSVNGVLLNGQRVHTALVGDGDVLHLGPYRVKVNVSERFFSRNADEEELAGLADTGVMPAAEKRKPGHHLKVIK
jgi:hypothetical protein